MAAGGRKSSLLTNSMRKGTTKGCQKGTQWLFQTPSLKYALISLLDKRVGSKDKVMREAIMVTQPHVTGLIALFDSPGKI